MLPTKFAMHQTSYKDSGVISLKKHKLPISTYRKYSERQRNGVVPDGVTQSFLAQRKNFHNTVHEGFLLAEMKSCHAD